MTHPPVPLMPSLRLDRSAGSVPPSARVRCETLPVACVERRIVTLQRASATDSSTPGWCHELPPGQHPTRTVVDALARELDGIFDRATSIVHSTSWRYEAEYLVLSYLAVLQPAEPLTTAPPGFRLHPVEARPDDAGRSGDPAAIPVVDVLTHGLRHLAMLRISDPRIAASLSGDWHELLAGWKPLPAGLLEHYLHEHPAPVNHPRTPGSPSDSARPPRTYAVLPVHQR